MPSPLGLKSYPSSPTSLSSPHFLLPSSRIPKPLNSITRSCSSSSSSSFNLQSYWSSLLSEINSHLDSAVPLRYPESIYLSMRHSLLSPAAKRAPPVMCIAAAELISSSPSAARPAALPTAVALEMVHAASLIHDDLPSFDAASSRRGQPSTHSLFGVDLAILAGDALLPLALSHIAVASSDLVPPATTVRIIQEITRAVGGTGMAAGQFLDLINKDDNNSVITEELVMTVLEKKFGEMAECSAVCGGLIGGAGEEEFEMLRRYGRAVGMLYQVVDDVTMETETENGSALKMRSNASVVKAMGIDRALEIVDELREKARKELVHFGDKYGERVIPLYSFVDYAVERGFPVVAPLNQSFD